MPHLPNTITIDLDVESLRLQNKLALPVEIDTLGLEVTYSFYDGEPTTKVQQGCGASIEIEKIVVEVAYGCREHYNIPMEQVGSYTPCILSTATLTLQQSNLLVPLLDTDDIETLIWESREGMDSDNFMG